VVAAPCGIEIARALWLQRRAVLRYQKRCGCSAVRHWDSKSAVAAAPCGIEIAKALCLQRRAVLREQERCGCSAVRY